MSARPAKEDLWSYVSRVRSEIEAALERYAPLAPAPLGARFNDALRYSLFPGGKRLRPVLVMLGAEAVGGRGRDMLAAGAAVEYVHTSSLIFDDLPCMDDAKERRGRAALHVAFDESLAMLVALALMNASYGLIFDGRENHARTIEAHGELIAGIGAARGMVIGQTVDLSHGVPIGSVSGNEREAIRNLKTSALMRLALRLGAILSGASAEQLTALSRYAELLGDAYQMSDDLLDLDEDAAMSVGGRGATSVIERGKGTAIRRVEILTRQAKQSLIEQFGETSPAHLLCGLGDYIATRGSSSKDEG